MHKFNLILDLLNQSLPGDKTPLWCMCTLKYEEFCWREASQEPPGQGHLSIEEKLTPGLSHWEVELCNTTSRTNPVQEYSVKAVRHVTLQSYTRNYLTVNVVSAEAHTFMHTILPPFPR